MFGPYLFNVKCSCVCKGAQHRQLHTANMYTYLHQKFNTLISDYHKKRGCYSSFPLNILTSWASFGFQGIRSRAFLYRSTASPMCASAFSSLSNPCCANRISPRPRSCRVSASSSTQSHPRALRSTSVACLSAANSPLSSPVSRSTSALHIRHAPNCAFDGRSFGCRCIAASLAATAMSNGRSCMARFCSSKSLLANSSNARLNASCLSHFSSVAPIPDTHRPWYSDAFVNDATTIASGSSLAPAVSLLPPLAPSALSSSSSSSSSSPMINATRAFSTNAKAVAPKMSAGVTVEMSPSAVV
eukprot:m.663126 g.663126  ORF g.663126 m.663126 type:complete len:301 (-) comp22742_c1_seq37:1456-2358(-)